MLCLLLLQVLLLLSISLNDVNDYPKECGAGGRGRGVQGSGVGWGGDVIGGSMFVKLDDVV